MKFTFQTVLNIILILTVSVLAVGTIWQSPGKPASADLHLSIKEGGYIALDKGEAASLTLIVSNSGNKSGNVLYVLEVNNNEAVDFPKPIIVDPNGVVETTLQPSLKPGRNFVEIHLQGNANFLSGNSLWTVIDVS
jgi:hypothetical protein